MLKSKENYNKTIKEIVEQLDRFWLSKDVRINIQEYNKVPIGAATLHPLSLLRFNGTIRDNIAFSQICFRPLDMKCISSSYLRSDSFHQYQVLINCSEQEVFEYIVGSIRYLDIESRYINYHQDRWSSDIVGAYGDGYEIRYGPLEIAQLTHFYMYNHSRIDKVYEIAYGIDRLAMISTGFQRNRYNAKRSIFIQSCSENCPTCKVAERFHDRDNNYIDKLIEAMNDTEYEDINAAYRDFCYIVNLFNEIDALCLIGDIAKKLYLHELGKLFSKISERYEVKNFERFDV